MKNVITLEDLEAEGFTVDDVEQLCPGAVERRALDGSLCWLAEDLIPLMGAPEE